MRNARSKKTKNAPGNQGKLVLLIRHHRYALKNVFNSIRQSRWTVFINSVILGLSLSLPLALASVANHFDLFTAMFAPRATLYLQLEDTTNDSASADLLKQLSADHRVDTLLYLSREDILESVLQQLDIEPSSSLIDINPFVNTIKISVATNAGSTESLGGELKSDNRIAHIEVAKGSSKSDLSDFVVLFQRSAKVLSAIVLLSTLLICGYMVRNQILRQHLEIEVTRYCGGETNFIRRPFLYWGAMQGCLGAMCAGAIVYLCFSFLLTPFSALIDTARMPNLPPLFYIHELLATLVVGIVIGFIGAWIATKLQLSAMTRTENQPSLAS